MKTCLIIACDNGFGHIRRCLLIANKLAELGCKIHLYGNIIAIEKFRNITGIHKNVEPFQFNTNTSISSIKQGKPDLWYLRLPSISSYDFVISDNLPEILLIRSDAILSGSFLWHRVVDAVDQTFYSETENLVRQYKPKMIGTKLFTDPNLGEITDLQLVGLIVPETRNQFESSGEDLLITCGKSGEHESAILKLIFDLIQNRKTTPFDTVWVEPALLPGSHPEWMKKATYDKAMYTRVKAAICRPGIGTLTDCLYYGARVFCTFEAGNKEMLHNSIKLKQNNIGDYFESPNEAFSEACYFAHDRSLQKQHNISLQQISFDGLSQTVKLILDL
jgi:hypothetical protein